MPRGTAKAVKFLQPQPARYTGTKWGQFADMPGTLLRLQPGMKTRDGCRTGRRTAIGTPKTIRPPRYSPAPQFAD